MRLGRTILCCAALGLGPAPAHGDDVTAKRYRDQAFVYFEEGDWGLGIAAMEKAHALLPHPDFLFNIAVAHRKWGARCPEALNAIARFISACDGCEALGDGLRELATIRAQCPTRPLLLRTEPEGASIFLGGHSLPIRAPATATVAVGRQEVTIVSEKSAIAMRLVVPASTLVDEIVLASPARQRPAVRVRGGAVTVDGLSIDGPKELAVGEGAHRIQLGDASFDVAIAPGQVFVMGHPSAPTQSVALAPAETPVAPALQVAAWASVAVAASAAVAATVFTAAEIDAIGRREEAVMTQADPMVVTGIESDARRDAIASRIAFSVAAAGAIAAVVLFILDL